MRMNRSSYEVLQILSISLTNTTHIKDFFENNIQK